MKRLIKIVIIIISIILLIIITLLLYRIHKQVKIKNETFLNCKNCIDTIIQFNIENNQINGLIRTENTENPILLCVHGGPGIPDMPFARKYDNLLVREFIIIRYDQRGVGKSYKGYEIDNITIDDNVNDLLSITKQIKNKFPNKPIYLLGHSWGTLLCILAIIKEPNLYYKYFGVEQIVNLQESDLLSYDFVVEQATKKDNQKILDEILVLKRENYNLDYANLIQQRKLLTEIGGRFFDNEIKTTLLWTAIFSPDYSISEFWATNKNSKLLDKKLYKEMLKYNLFEIADSISIPCYFISGKYDYQTPTPIVEKYFNSLKCNNKEIYIFDKSGHLPNYEQPELFYNILKGLK